MANFAPIIVLALAAAALGGRRRGGGSAPPVPSGGGIRGVFDWSDWVEETGALPGFARFAAAAAYTESKGNNRVGLGVSQGILPSNVKLNTGTAGARNEQKAACSLYKGAKSRGYYSGNPYPASRWCFGSGGWFGFLPATGLAAGGTKGPFAEGDPFLVFQPIESIVMMADFAKRVIRSNRFQSLPYGEQNWLAIRRGMAASSLIDDYTEENERSPKTRERLERALAETGTDPDFMWERASVGDWPGAKSLLNWLYQHQAAA